MPIIAANKNPPSKPFDCPITEIGEVWWIAKLKPRQEKAFAFELLGHSIDYYLPYYVKRHQRSDGKFRKSYLPLFPSYISFATEDPYAFLKSGRVVSILPVQAQIRFKAQLQQVYDMLNYGARITPLNLNAYEIGERVRVIQGPLKGICGHITELRSEAYLIIEVDGIGKAKVEISTIGTEKCS